MARRVGRQLGTQHHLLAEPGAAGLLDGCLQAGDGASARAACGATAAVRAPFTSTSTRSCSARRAMQARVFRVHQPGLQLRVPLARARHRVALRQRAARVKSVLADTKYTDAWEAYPFNSGYFMCLKLREGLDGESIR